MTRQMLAKVSYTIREAAAATGFSVDTIERALKATDPLNFPPPLAGKRAGTGPRAKHVIPAGELTRWVDSLPDA